MEEEKIMEFITSDYSWEQVVYKIIAWEGLDPWNLDLNVLSDSFLQYIKKMKQMDFRVPAKYIIISSVLLRMKSDHLNYLGDLSQEEMVDEISDEIIEPVGGDEDITSLKQLEINAISVPPNRQPKRKVMVDELLKALKSAMSTRERRLVKEAKRRKKISIRDDNLTSRISGLYQKINDIIGRLKKDEVEFSKVVDKWERNEVINTFLPLVFLDHQKKVSCRQEEVFKEIFIKKREN